MQQNDNNLLQCTSTTGSSHTIHLGGRSRISLVRVQNQKLRVTNERSNLPRLRRESSTCASRADVRLSSRSREPSQSPSRASGRIKSCSREKVLSTPEFIVSDCWNSPSREMPVKLIQLFKEDCPEVEDLDQDVKKQKLETDDNEMLSYTKEFHVLNEVQKERILTVVEDTIKKLANRDLKDYSQGYNEPSRQEELTPAKQFSNEMFFCKKFLLPWVMVKVMELILCHIIELTFLSEENYFDRKSEFLPVVVTYYITLFIVIMSLVAHTTCFSCGGIRNPCYFMGAISFSILTLTTTLGILVMLSSMEYYKTFREILVLVFIGILLCTLFGELCLCYFEVKTIWNSLGETEFYCEE